MNNNSQSSRVFIFDLVKICLVVLVINIHARLLGGYFQNIFTPYEYFAVPLFLIISFFLTAKYFTGEPLPTNKIGQRLKRLAIPLLFWSAIGFLTHLNLLTISHILTQIITGERVNVPLYFLNLLIVFTLLYWLISFLPFTIRLMLYGLLTAIAFYLQYSLLNFHFFSPYSEAWKNSYGRFIELLPYTASGIYLYLVSKTKKSQIGLILLSIFSFVLYQFVISKDFIPGFHYSGLSLFFGTLAIFSLVLLVSSLRLHLHVHRVIEVLGKLSFGVYLMHFPLLEYVVNTFPATKTYIVYNSVLFVLGFTTICFTLCLLLVKVSRGKLAFLLQ